MVKNIFYILFPFANLDLVNQYGSRNGLFKTRPSFKNLIFQKLINCHLSNKLERLFNFWEEMVLVIDLALCALYSAAQAVYSPWS